MDVRLQPPSNERDFERLCVDVLRAHWLGSNPQTWGRRGQKQQGVDIIDLQAIEPLRAAQCKWKGLGLFVTPAEIQAEVDKALQFAHGGLTIGRYVILTTADNDTEAQGKILEINRAHRSSGHFSVELLAWPAIEEIIRNNPELFRRYCGAVARLVEALVEPLGAGIDTAHRKLDAIAVQLTFESSDERLSVVRTMIEAYDYQGASLHLNRIRANHWEALTPKQRFLVLTYQGNIAYAEGKLRDAASRFFEAAAHAPEEERAKTNEAVAHELIEQSAEAYRFARELLVTFPGSVRPWAIVCRSAPATSSAQELLEELPPAAKLNDEVLLGLATRAAAGRDWALAESLAGQSSANSPKWAPPHLVHGQAMVHRLRETGYVASDGSLWPKTDETWSAILAAFDRAVTIAEQTDHGAVHIQALTSRAFAKVLSGDRDGARTDYAEAHRLDPDGPGSTSYGKFLLMFRSPESAVPLLRPGGADSADDASSFALAVALRSAEEPASKDQWRALCRRVAENPQAAHRCAALQLVLDEQIAAGKHTEAMAWLESLGESLTACAREAGCALLAHEQGDSTAAKSHLARAAAGTDGATLDCLRMVARIAERIGSHDHALPIWQVITTRSREVPDARCLVVAALRRGRLDIVRSVTREWRSVGIRDPELLNAELPLLERYEPQEAIARIQEELVDRPNDSDLLFRLTHLGVRLGRPELLIKERSRFPEPGAVAADEGLLAAQTLAAAGAPLEAIAYAYEVLRHHRHDATANQGFAYLMLRHATDLAPFLAAAMEVRPDTAVCYREGERAEKHWIVIERQADGHGYDDEVPPEHALAKALAGARAGEGRVVRADDSQGPSLHVEQVMAKYVYRLNRILEVSPHKFPERPFVTKFTLGAAAGEHGLPDITEMIRVMHGRKQAVEQAIRSYCEHAVSIHLVAHTIGNHFMETQRHLAYDPDALVRVCLPDLADFAAIATAQRSASAWVLDLSALTTLGLLGLYNLLAKWPTPLVVSTNTLEQLVAFRDDTLSSHPRGSLTAAESDIGIRYIPANPEAHRAELEAINELISFIRTHAVVRDCGELADVEPELREALIEGVGQHGAESIVLAARPGHILWTDDAVVGAIARQEFGVQRTWTQCALDVARVQGVLEPQEFLEASAKLIGFDYQPTAMEGNVFFAAAIVADWEPAARPLKQALAVLSEPEATSRRIATAAVFIRRILTQDVELPGHETVIRAVLDHLAQSQPGLAAILVIREKLPILFGVNVAAEQRARAIIRAWLEANELRQRP